MTGKLLKGTTSGDITAYGELLLNVKKKTFGDQRPGQDLGTVYFTMEGTGKYSEKTEMADSILMRRKVAVG